MILVAAFVVLSLLWDLPVRLSGFAWPWLAAPALEIAAVFALLALVAPLRTGRAGQIAALAVALATTLVVALKAADLVIYESLGRPLNPVLDVHLARSLVDLLTEALGGLLGWLLSGRARPASAPGVRGFSGGGSCNAARSHRPSPGTRRRPAPRSSACLRYSNCCRRLSGSAGRCRTRPA